jgi:tRNA-dihydrouridine synthase
MTKCAELLQNEISLDFVDINIGCPIDLVFTKVTAMYWYLKANQISYL